MTKRQGRTAIPVVTAILPVALLISALIATIIIKGPASVSTTGPYVLFIAAGCALALGIRHGSASRRSLTTGLLRSGGHELLGLPGFRTYYGDWTITGPKGFLIPVRNKNGLIQGMKIRLDDADKPNRKYRWLSSRDMTDGTRSYSWVHVTGDTTSKRAYLTEGPLKGDVASYLAHDALFVCIGGVNAIRGLKDTLKDLGATQVVEAMDMDQMTNPDVRNAVLAMRREVQAIKGLKYTKYTWDPAYKGVDYYLFSRVTAM